MTIQTVREASKTSPTKILVDNFDTVILIKLTSLRNCPSPKDKSLRWRTRNSFSLLPPPLGLKGGGGI